MTRGNYQLLSGGKLIGANSICRKDILICGEKILRIQDHFSETPSDCRVIDCSGKLIFPGIIDAQVHIRSVETDSRLALKGGVTTVLDFSRQTGERSLYDEITQRKRELSGFLPDSRLHCTISTLDNGILKELPGIVKQGVASFKVYTTSVQGQNALNYAEIELLAESIAGTEAVLIVHAEDDLVIKQATEHLMAKKRTQTAYFGLSRPAIAEVNAVRKLGNIAMRTGCKLYISQLSTGAAFELAGQYPNLILETTPQHLLLDENVYNRKDGRMFLDCPPLRRQSDNQLLWNGLLRGHIHIISSHHSAFMPVEKPVGQPFHVLPEGMSGMETLFPLLLAKFLETGTRLSLLSGLLSENPARVFGLHPGKGTLTPGADADLVIVDPHSITDDWELFSDHERLWNPFYGLPAVFPEKVFLKGKMNLNGPGHRFPVSNSGS